MAAFSCAETSFSATSSKGLAPLAPEEGSHLPIDGEDEVVGGDNLVVRCPDQLQGHIDIAHGLGVGTDQDGLGLVVVGDLLHLAGEEQFPFPLLDEKGAG